MDTNDVPRSYSVRRIVPTYKPARTPYVGKPLTLFQGAPWSRTKEPIPYVVIRETEGNGEKPGIYWVAPVLPDGTLGAMTTTPLSKDELTA